MNKSPTEQILETVRLLREARAKATQGEWTSHDNHGVRYVSNGLDGQFAEFDNRICEASFNLHHPPINENMNFITLAANKMDQLCECLAICVEALERISKSPCWTLQDKFDTHTRGPLQATYAMSTVKLSDEAITKAANILAKGK